MYVKKKKHACCIPIVGPLKIVPLQEKLYTTPTKNTFTVHLLTVRCISLPRPKARPPYGKAQPTRKVWMQLHFQPPRDGTGEFNCGANSLARLVVKVAEIIAQWVTKTLAEWDLKKNMDFE